MKQNLKKKIIRTRVKYIGIDMNNRSSALEDSWLKDNFNKPDLEVFWNTVLSCFIPFRDRGVPLKYIQIDGDDYCTYSLPSAFEIIGKTEISNMLIKLNKIFLQVGTNVECLIFWI